MKITILIALLLAMLLWVVLNAGAKKQDQNRDAAKGPEFEPVDPSMFDVDEAFHVAGINMNRASVRDCGTWKGFVFRDMENKYDKNAVAVFKGTKHIGYLHKEIAARYAKAIEERGGTLPAFVMIEQLRDEEDGHLFLNGMVQILWDDTE